jgi:hypothetical protein
VGSFLINGELWLMLLSLIVGDDLREQLQGFGSLGLRHLMGGSLEDHKHEISRIILDEAGVLIIGEPRLAA